MLDPWPLNNIGLQRMVFGVMSGHANSSCRVAPSMRVGVAIFNNVRPPFFLLPVLTNQRQEVWRKQGQEPEGEAEARSSLMSGQHDEPMFLSFCPSSASPISKAAAAPFLLATASCSWDRPVHPGGPGPAMEGLASCPCAAPCGGEIAARAFRFKILSSFFHIACCSAPVRK